MNRPLRVLHVLESLGHGGAEQNLLSQLRKLAPPDFEHTLAWLYDDTRLLSEFRPHVAQLLPLGVAKPWHLLRAVARLAGYVRSARPDVIHVQLVRAQVVARLASLLSATGRPVVTTWQNAFYDDRARGDFGGSQVTRQLVRLADGVTGLRDAHFVAVSEFVAADVRAALHVAPERVTVVYNCVEAERYQPVGAQELNALRRALGLSEEDKILLSVGRLVPQKQQLSAILAMPEILRAHPHACLLIAGGGPMEGELRAASERLGLGNRVQLLGRRSDVSKLYQLADVFVFPSSFEGLSVALLEALSNGLPSAISDIPQNREVAANLASVRYAPVGSVEVLAQATIALLDGGRALRDTARHAAGAIQERFSAERLSGELAVILRRAAAKRPVERA